MQARWSDLPTYKITAIEFNLIDRLHLILEIAKQYVRSTKAIYFWNPSYDFLQNVEVKIDVSEVIFENSGYTVDKQITAVCNKIQEPAVFIFEGLKKFDSKFNYELRN